MFYDGQHLFIMNRVISFGRGHGMRHVHDGSEFAIITFDANHFPNGKLRHVSLKAEFAVLVRVLQHRCSSESSLQCLEQSSFPITKVKYNILASQVHHGMTNNSVVFDEASIEVAETEESVDLLCICWFRPLQDSINLFRIHLDPIM